MSETSVFYFKVTIVLIGSCEIEILDMGVRDMAPDEF